MPQVSPGRVLVVEDEDFVRDAMTRLFRGAGYDADGAADGRQALARLRSAPAPTSSCST